MSNFKFIKLLFVLCFIGCFSCLFAQGEYKLVLQTRKMANNQNLGRSIGFPISKKSFKIDSSGCQNLYVCEVPLTARAIHPGIKLHYLIGQKKVGGELSVTFDRNFDDSFLDEKAISINPNSDKNCDFKTLEDTINLNVSQSAISNSNITLHIIAPFCFANLKRKTKTPFLDTMNIALESPFEHVADINVDGKLHTVSVRNLFPQIDLTNKGNVKIYIDNLDNNKPGTEAYGLEDTIKIASQYFAITHLSRAGDSITIKRVPDTSAIGYKQGFYAYPFREKEILSNRLISRNDFEDHFLLLEFWGTWCVPCMSLHDDLIKLLDSTPQLKYLGVAYDKSIDSVKKLALKSPGMNNQIFVEMNSKKTSIIDMFRVSDYPTFVLIDPKGKIVFRDTGVGGFNKLRAYLQ